MAADAGASSAIGSGSLRKPSKAICFVPDAAYAMSAACRGSLDSAALGTPRRTNGGDLPLHSSQLGASTAASAAGALAIGCTPRGTKSASSSLHLPALPRRFGLEPSLCTGAAGNPIVRPSCIKTFPDAPMMQSTVDQVVFNRDMDYSGGSKYDAEFLAIFTGMAGLPSWHRVHE
eukprot:TRINITY_DN16455_c0_g1_i1.p1 TRINITY_DN16455_c0_g1~~TRINITY_DN16455_c0_g1_i1.p1  ORF type:complete len:175 (-),score=21.79 TRINITY_DN16455_c0_g1_i1:141-665(-)